MITFPPFLRISSNERDRPGFPNEGKGGKIRLPQGRGEERRIKEGRGGEGKKLRKHKERGKEVGE